MGSPHQGASCGLDGEFEFRIFSMASISTSAVLTIYVHEQAMKHYYLHKQISGPPTFLTGRVAFPAEYGAIACATI